MPARILPDQQLSNAKRDDVLAHSKGLYRHAKRPEWGLAILAWEEGGKRGYQFDDGQLRVFKEGYYSLMEQVREPGAAPEMRKDLEDALVVSTRHGGRKPLTPAYPFEDQLQIFSTLFPDGFADLAWIRKYRGNGEKTRRKSHREPTLHDAASQLGQTSMRDLLAKNDHEALLEDVAGLLVTTDLVPVRQAQSLREIPADLRRPVAESLTTMLHGDGKFGPRFRAWVLAMRDALGKRPGWGLATAPAALLRPDEHVCVRASTFKRQAAVIAPDRVYSARPRRRSYENFRHVARTTRERLAAAGHEPRDLLDVHDFIWVTLRPAAAQHRGQG